MKLDICPRTQRWHVSPMRAPLSTTVDGWLDNERINLMRTGQRSEGQRAPSSRVAFVRRPRRTRLPGQNIQRGGIGDVERDVSRLEESSRITSQHDDSTCPSALGSPLERRQRPDHARCPPLSPHVATLPHDHRPANRCSPCFSPTRARHVQTSSVQFHMTKANAPSEVTPRPPGPFN